MLYARGSVSVTVVFRNVSQSIELMIGAITRNTLLTLNCYLGDDHDLAVLRSIIASGKGQGEKTGFIGELIDRQREKRRSKAIASGEPLYRERPREFVRHLLACVTLTLSP
jgi:hypothetical protein